MVGVDKYQALMDGVAALSGEVRAIAEDMTTEEGYAEVKALARKRLGRAYAENEFPDRVALRKKYSVEVISSVIPRTDDIRIQGLTQAAQDNVRESMESQYATRITETMREAVAGLTELLKTMQEMLDDEEQEGKRYGVVMNSAKRMVAGFHNMNLTGDPELSILIDAATEVLTKADSEALRTNPDARKIIKKQAADLNDALANFGL